MILLLKLLLAHLLGDFFLQPTAWVASKEKNKIKSIWFYFHLLIHAGLLALILWDWNFWGLILALTVTHGLIDLLKLFRQNPQSKPRWFIIDQVLHLISILVIWWIWEKPDFPFAPLFQNTKLLLIVFAVLFLTLPAGIVLANVLKKWSVDIQKEPNQSLENAGKYIGILERLFVFVFILTDHWEGVGFLITAKSVFRFGDLRKSKQRKLTEYILIGTLLSFGIAMGIGLLVYHFM